MKIWIMILVLIGLVSAAYVCSNSQIAEKQNVMSDYMKFTRGQAFSAQKNQNMNDILTKMICKPEPTKTLMAAVAASSKSPTTRTNSPAAIIPNNRTIGNQTSTMPLTRTQLMQQQAIARQAATTEMRQHVLKVRQAYANIHRITVAGVMPQ
jgi:hypothetical protein